MGDNRYGQRGVGDAESRKIPHVALKVSGG
jgi:hypothetical protein